jgi:hypothetical protein
MQKVDQKIQGSEITSMRKARQIARDIRITLENDKVNRFFLTPELIIVHGECEDRDWEPNGKFGLKMYDVGPDCDGVQPATFPLDRELFVEFIFDSEEEMVLEIN